MVQQNSESVIDVDKTKYIDEPRRRDSGDCVLPTSLSKANLVLLFRQIAWEQLLFQRHKTLREGTYSGCANYRPTAPKTTRCCKTFQLTGFRPPLLSFSSCSIASFHIPCTPHSFTWPAPSLATTAESPARPLTTAARPATAPSTTGASNVLPGSAPAAPANREGKRRPDRRALGATESSAPCCLATGGLVATAGVGVAVLPPACCCPPRHRALCTHPSATSGLSPSRISERSTTDALIFTSPRGRCRGRRRRVAIVGGCITLKCCNLQSFLHLRGHRPSLEREGAGPWLNLRARC